MRGTKRGIVAAIALSGALVLSACSGTPTDSSSGETTKAPYTVGFNDDLSGPISFAGLSVLAGFQTYIDYVNDTQGGVNGHKIELKTTKSLRDAAEGGACGAQAEP